MKDTNMLTLVTVQEIARRNGSCPQTLKKRLLAGEIIADALLVQGHRSPFPLFDLSRPEIQKLITHEPQIA